MEKLRGAKDLIERGVGILFALNPSMTNELLDLRRDYLTDVRQTAARMREQSRGLGEHDRFKDSFPELLFLAHQLRGSGGSLGFPKISEVARTMTEQLNHFLDPSEIDRPTPDQLSKTLISLSQELEREAAAAQRSLQ